MAGRGPAGKLPEDRARRNKDNIGQTVLTFVPGEQPALPQLYREITVEDVPTQVAVDWHQQTIEWWAMWGEAAQSDVFTATDWSVLLDTAFIHHQFWSGDMKAAPELRLRVAKFGATPEDRARLRMVFAEADKKDAERGTTSSGPKPQGAYGGLRAVKSS